MLKPSVRDQMFKRAVGLLVVASVLVLILFLRVYKQTAAPFKETFRLETLVERADGIIINAPVTIAGIKIGWVQDIQILDDAQVSLTLEIDRAVAPKLHANSEAYVIRPLLGSASVDLTMGSPGQPPLREGAKISGSKSPDINDIIASLPTKLEKIDATLTDLVAISGNLRNISQAATSGNTSLVSALADVRTTSREAAAAAGQLSALLKDTRDTVKGVGLAVGKTHGVIDDVRATSSRIGGMTDKIDRALDDTLALSRELRSAAPKIPPAVSSARDVLDDTSNIMFGVKNNFLLRGSLPEEGPPPALPLPR